MRSKINCKIAFSSKINSKSVFLRMILRTVDGVPVTMLTGKEGFEITSDYNQLIEFNIDISRLVPGRYTLSPVIYEANKYGGNSNLDGLKDAYCFEIATKKIFTTILLGHLDSGIVFIMIRFQ